MLDPELQQRFARHCTDAAFGYSAATTAAYAAMADQVMGFWSAVLQSPEPKREPAAWQWPVPLAPASKSPAATTPMALFNPFLLGSPAARRAATAQGPSLPTNPWEAMSQFAEVMSGALTALSATPVKPAPSPANPMAAWLTTFPFMPPTAAWPMAFMMMSQGVPQAVAWPTAEANAAVLDAAEIARRSIKQAFASYQSEGGHAAGGNVWPPTDMLTLFAAVPLNVGTMLTAMKLH